MSEIEYRNWLIGEILKRRAWCKRSRETEETLKKRSTRILEKIYDFAE